VELVGERTNSGADPATGPASPRPSKLGFADADAARRPRRAHPLARAAVFGGMAALVGGGGFFAWKQVIEPRMRTGTNPPASASAAPSATPSADASASVTTSARLPVPDNPLPAWMSIVREGQQAIVAGDLKLAQKLFKDAFDKGAGHGIPRTMGEHIG